MQFSDCKTTPVDNNLQGWILTSLSGLACCLGASVVFSDLFFQKFLCTRYIQTVHNSKFLVGSLSLGSGVMLYSSLYTMLHEAKESFVRTPKSKEYAGIYLIAFYFLGVIGSAVINKLIHFALGEPSTHSHNHHHHYHSFGNNYADLHDERSPLVCSERHSVCISDTEGTALYHPINDQREQLMRIGIQTALAISIHKFPEGLITFISSQVSPTIGLALFFAIALHNISEGFTIALPLYMATRSRTKSFLYASLLGGLSQPFGALIGYIFLKESELSCWDHNFIYGALFAAVGGLMGFICIQGMLPQAIKNDKSDGFLVSVFFFIGILIMGISSALLDIANLNP